MAIRNTIATSASALRVMTSSLPLAVGRTLRREFGLLPLTMLCGTAAGAPPVSATTMASRLVENAKAEVILGQGKAADLDGVMSDHRSLLSLVGASPTTLRSLGIVLALVAVVALGKTTCFPSAALVEDVVQRANSANHDVVPPNSLISRNQEDPQSDSSIDLSDSGEVSEALDQILQGLLPPPGRNVDSYPSLDHDPNHDVHLTGSQFGLDDLPNIRCSAHMPSDICAPVASPADSSGEELPSDPLDHVFGVVDKYHDIDFDFTVYGPKDNDSVSVASMVAVFNEDSSTDFSSESSSIV